MTAEFHVARGRFAVLVARVFQHHQRLTCIAPASDVYIERIAALADQAEWGFDGSNPELRLPMDAFVSTRDKVLAATDDPSDAAAVPLRLTVMLRVQLVDRALTVTVNNIEFGIAGHLAVVAETVRAAVMAAIGAFPRIELGELIHGLSLAHAISGSELVMTEHRLIARFGDLSGPPAPVAHDFEWALFIDGVTIAQMTRRRFPVALPRLTSIDTGADWAPIGTTGERAQVSARITSTTTVAGESYDVFVGFECTPTMRDPMSMPALRIDTNYSVHVNPPLPPTPHSMTIAEVLEQELQQELIDPAGFGGVRTGPASFAMSLALPQLRVDGRLWLYEGLVSGLAGVVLGGSTFVPPELPASTLKVTTRQFSGSTHADLWCHKGHLPTTIPYAGLFRTVAMVEYSGAGALCGVEVIPGGLGLEQRLTLPKAIPLTGGRRPGEGTIFMAFGLEEANRISHEILLVLRTTSGVRCVNLGMPEHVQIKPDGTIDGVVMYWDDCNMLPPGFLAGEMTPEEYDRWRGVIWYTYWGLQPGEYDPDNPPIVPDSLDAIPPHWDEMLVVPRIRFRETVIVPEVIVTVPPDFRVLDVEKLATPHG